MKKSIVTLTLVLTMGIGFSAVSAFAWYCNGPGSGYGMRGYNSAPVDDETYNKFMQETAELRKSLAVDRAELNAVMAGDNPDPKKVAELTGRIVDSQEALAAKAREAKIDVGPGCGIAGRGYGPRGNCDGPGSGPRGQRGNCPGPGFGPRGYVE